MSGPKPLPEGYTTWLADWTKVTNAIDTHGWTFTLDGELYVSNEAPEDIIRIYDGLRQRGYANGYFDA